MEWNKIDSAPRDETAISGYQKATDEIWIIAPMYFTNGEWMFLQYHDANTEFIANPTHWMPIPDPPK